ncbi:RrF2 family transcriptional regulator [Paenarthrobacter sp. NyZ202]|uniref:RrF2 family transcriptional regulator n=1 Tax=Paenarthrobacter sp. NyZ202 TaxID=3402689 RepID=UPI003CF23DA7
MKINAFADVSLRAVMVLAAAPDGTLLTTQAVANAVGTPYNHVSKAMVRLREMGLIDVERGRLGGSRLNTAGRRATVGQILRQLDSRQDPAECQSPNGDCPLLTECGLRHAMKRAREAFYRELDAVVISSLPHARQMAPVFQTIGLRPEFQHASAGEPATSPQAAPALPS